MSSQREVIQVVEEIMGIAEGLVDELQQKNNDSLRTHGSITGDPVTRHKLEKDIAWTSGGITALEVLKAQVRKGEW